MPQNTFIYPEIISADTISALPIYSLTPQQLNFVESASLLPDPCDLRKEELISPHRGNQDLLVLLVLLSFLFLSLLVRSKKLMLAEVFKSLLYFNARSESFSDTSLQKIPSKFAFTLVSSFIFSILSFQFICGFAETKIDSAETILLICGIFTILILAFIFLKLISYKILGYVFFSKLSTALWIDTYLSYTIVSGLVFLPIALLFLSLNLPYVYILYLGLFYFFFVLILMFNKLQGIFFPDKRLILHLLLYLCTQEIIPLYLFYRTMIFMFNIVEKITL